MEMSAPAVISLSTPYIEGIPPPPLPAAAVPPSQILHLTLIGWLRSFVII